MEKGKRMEDGSYTVEASLILCFIICVMLGIIYMGFYLYDYYMAEVIMTEIAKRESQFIIEYSDRVDGEIDWEEWSNRSIIWRLFYNNEGNELTQQIEEQLEKKLLISKLDQVKVNVKREEIELQYQLTVYFPGKWIQTILNARSLNIIHQMKFEEKESEELIRICRAIKNNE